MNDLALKMLLGDRAKYITLLSGLPNPLPPGVLEVVITICASVAVLAIRKIKKLKHAIGFRG